MAKKPTGDVIDQLAFPIHEMLDLPVSTRMQIETITSGTTAVALRVTALADPGCSYFVKTLRAGGGSGPHLKLGLHEVKFYALIETLSPVVYPNIPKCFKHFIS